MPKLKTRKCVSKRVRITTTGKIISKTCGQDHFNARESGKTTRNKRQHHELSETLRRNIERAINN